MFFLTLAHPVPSGQEATLGMLVEGCRLPVNRTKDDQTDWTPAEILSKRKNSKGEWQYYIHYVDFNKRLDEWVGQSRLDLRNGPPLLHFCFFFCIFAFFAFLHFFPMNFEVKHVKKVGGVCYYCSKTYEKTSYFSTNKRTN